MRLRQFHRAKRAAALGNLGDALRGLAGRPRSGSVQFGAPDFIALVPQLAAAAQRYHLSMIGLTMPRSLLGADEEIE